MSEHEHETGGTTPEPSITREEFTGLSSAVEEMREALAELRQASTPAERHQAEGGVRDARADLNEVAKELGLDPKRLTAAAEKAKAEDERERLRPILVELLDEELSVTEVVEEATGAVKGAAAAAAETIEAAVPKPDTAPGESHWSDRPLSSLFGNG